MMSGFPAHTFVDKLNRLNNSQQSIETISAWCIFYRKVRFLPVFDFSLSTCTICPCSSKCVPSKQTMPQNVEHVGGPPDHATVAAQDARKIVVTWETEFAKAPNMQKKLAMLYLANDILQNSRKKGPEFVNEFYRALPRALHHMLKHGDDKVRGSTHTQGL
jgi:regulator of Ty1 transposition protein 103